MKHLSDRIVNQSTIKLALLAKQTHSQVEDILAAEPIAVIGTGCRFPGGGDNPDNFWETLLSKTDAAAEVPPDRFDVNDFYDPDTAAVGKMNSRKAGFLPRVDDFDAHYFGIHPREAVRMDPQQRLMLEVAFEALENAGMPHTKLAGTNTGVFIASYHSDYSRMQYADLDSIDVRTLTGTLHAIVANRLSFLLDLHGPSLALDTACSSSLVAVHLACQSLRNRESDIAIAGGVSLIISPDMNIALSKVGFIAPDGSCKTFDAKADGFARGEGCGAIILKRLADAITDGDRILAVIRGSAVNQDGHSSLLTAPNGLAQQAVVSQALFNAGIRPEQISHIEAHGTGTLLGDPIEADALIQALGPVKSPDHKCYLTSVKTNLGHLEAAAGMAGIIKVILSLHKGMIPAHTKFSELNPHISFENTPLEIPTENIPWPPGEKPRYAGVSSFGVGGTNAHIIVGEAPKIERKPSQKEEETLNPKAEYLLPISAKTADALQDLTNSYIAYLGETNANLHDICFTASVRHTHHEYRSAWVGATRDEFIQKLSNARPTDRNSAERSTPPKIAFVFSGQGPQWWAMGRELLIQEPVFRQTLEQIDQLLSPLAGWSLLEEFSTSEASSRFDQTEIAQPAIFALQMGLDALWRAWGIEPSAVVGHSVGEIAAAVSVGILTMADAVHLVYHRARLMQQADGNGKMASVNIPFDRLEPLVESYGERLSIAAVNSPETCVISGETGALDEICGDLENEGVVVRKLRVNYAFHSAQMTPYADELTRILANLSPKNGTETMFSTVTGEVIQGENLSGAYWGRNMRQPVRFARAIENMAQDGIDIFLELSPHPVLSPMITQTIEPSGLTGAAIPSLRRNLPERATMLEALGHLYKQGLPISWEKQFSQNGQVVSLPLYPWQRERYWFEASHPVQRDSYRTPGRHPLLGIPVRSPILEGLLFQSEISTEVPAFLTDHRVLGEVVFPAAASLEIVLAGAQHIYKEYPLAIENIAFPEALVLFEGKSNLIQLHLSPNNDGRANFKLFSSTDSDKNDLALSGFSQSPWLQHASGYLHPAKNDEPETISLKSLQAKCNASLNSTEYYASLADRGNLFGPTFQGVQSLWVGSSEALAKIRLPEVENSESAYIFHPALLDSVFQTIAAILPNDWGSTDTYVPIGIDQFVLYRKPSTEMWGYVQLQSVSTTKETLTGNIQAFDDAGQLILEISGFSIQRTSLSELRGALQTKEDLDRWFFEIDWYPKDLEKHIEKLPKRGFWLIIANPDGIGELLAQHLRATGRICKIISDPNSEAISRNYLEHFKGFIETSRKDEDKPLGGIINLNGLNNLPDADSLESATQLILGLLKALADLEISDLDGLWLTTCGAQPVDNSVTHSDQASLWGIGKTITLEHPGLHCKLVDLDPFEFPENNAKILANEILSADDETQLAYRNQSRFVARLAALDHGRGAESPERLTNTQPGLIDNLVLTPYQRQPVSKGMVEIQVYASGLNFRDVLKALDRYPGEIGLLGDECAGEIISVGEGVDNFLPGDRVVALASGSHASHVHVDARLVAPLPIHLSYEEAATIPIAYLTAYYSLHTLGRLTKGESIVVHAGAGGVGLAAVFLAQRAGAEIFATAGNPTKREYLRSLGVPHVLDSRSLDFADEILEQTNGKGVDMVLNSLAGDFIPATVRVLSESGRFLEIGKTDIWTHEKFHQIKPNADYHVIYLGDLFQNQPDEAGKLLRKILDDTHSDLQGSPKDYLPPIPRQSFPLAHAASAFRFMAQAKHIGKIVLTHPILESESSSRDTMRFRADASYLITGGFGGIGIHIARWMSSKGAQHIVIASRSKPSSPEALTLLKELENSGVQVLNLQADLANPEDTAHLMDEVLQNAPPLRGIFHAAGINDDGVLTQLDWQRFENVMMPKVNGARYLYEQSRYLPSGSLDFFVLFSSVASIFGSAGQGNYAAANAMLDALAYEWREQGFPAKSINWGIWEDTGMASRLSDSDINRYLRRGWGVLSPSSGLRSLEKALGQPKPQVIIFPADWPEFLSHNQDLRFFDTLSRDIDDTHIETKTQKSSSPQPEFIKRWLDTPSKLRRSLLLSFLSEEAVRAIGLPPGTKLDSRTALRDIGLDSLMAVELRNAISQALGISLPATLLFDYPTNEALADFLLKTVPAFGSLESSEVDSVSSAPPPTEKVGPPESTPATSLTELSEEEAEAQLLAELKALQNKRNN